MHIHNKTTKLPHSEYSLGPELLDVFRDLVKLVLSSTIHLQKVFMVNPERFAMWNCEQGDIQFTTQPIHVS
jgi:hypothetical protein